MNGEVSPERTGWRDEALSRRHRAWGFDIPAVDIDFLLVEYDRGECVGLVEYKNELAAVQYASHPSYRAIKGLADRSEVPFFACRYATDFGWFKAVPLNGLAKGCVPETRTMSEQDWVELMYRIRGRQMPPWIFGDPF